jgi:hypothetical protein
MEGRALDSSGSAEHFEHGNEQLASIKIQEFPEEINYLQLLKGNSAA